MKTLIISDVLLNNSLPCCQWGLEYVELIHCRRARSPILKGSDTKLHIMVRFCSWECGVLLDCHTGNYLSWATISTSAIPSHVSAYNGEVLFLGVWSTP